MLNLIPFAVLILFIAAALILFGRRRVPFSYVLLAAGFGAFSFAAWPFWPVDAKGEQQALVLSRTGLAAPMLIGPPCRMATSQAKNSSAFATPQAGISTRTAYQRRNAKRSCLGR